MVTEVEPGVWWLTGTRVEKAAAMTNWDYYEAQVCLLWLCLLWLYHMTCTCNWDYYEAQAYLLWLCLLWLCLLWLYLLWLHYMMHMFMHML